MPNDRPSPAALERVMQPMDFSFLTIHRETLHPWNMGLGKERAQMSNGKDDLRSLMIDTLNLTCGEANELLTLLTDQKYVEFEADQTDTFRLVFSSHGSSDIKAASYKPYNVVFNFKKAALSAEIGAIEVYLGADAMSNGRSAVLYIFLLCLKMLSCMKAELSPVDAELIEFLWRERLHRRLNADAEFEAFQRYMEERGKQPPTNLEYHQSLDRLAELNTLRLEEGAILIREKVVIKQ